MKYFSLGSLICGKQTIGLIDLNALEHATSIINCKVDSSTRHATCLVACVTSYNCTNM